VSAPDAATTAQTPAAAAAAAWLAAAAETCVTTAAVVVVASVAWSCLTGQTMEKARGAPVTAGGRQAELVEIQDDGATSVLQQLAAVHPAVAAIHPIRRLPRVQGLAMVASVV
jgi:hypothetical protein